MEANISQIAGVAGNTNSHSRGAVAGIFSVSASRREHAAVELPLYYAVSWLHTACVMFSIAAFVLVYCLRMNLFGVNPFPSHYHGDFWQTTTVAAMIFSVGMWILTLRFQDKVLVVMGRLSLLMAVVVMTLKAHDFLNLAYRPVRPDLMIHSMAKTRPVNDAEQTYVRDISFDGINISYELTAAQFQQQQANKDATNGRYRLMFPSVGRASRGIASVAEQDQGKAGGPDSVSERSSGRIDRAWQVINAWHAANDE